MEIQWHYHCAFEKTDYPIVIVLIIEYNIFIISTSIMVHDTSYRKYGGINEKQLL